MLIALADAVEILLKVAVVLQKLLELIDALLVVFEQLLSVFGLLLGALHLEVEGCAEGGNEQYEDNQYDGHNA